jgi:CheY-like chemotaxis protein
MCSRRPANICGRDEATAMDPILIAPRTRKVSKGRILAIEPDPPRAEALRDLISERVGAECEIVTTGRDAIPSIDLRLPDLILTSIFLPPREAAELNAHLQKLPGAAHVQVITLPYLVDVEDGRHGTSKVLRFLKRRSPLARPVDPRIVGEQIEAYLEQAQALSIRPSSRAVRSARPEPFDSPVMPPRSGPFDSPVMSARSGHAAGDAEARVFAARVHKLGRAYASDRRRARRRSAGELPWLWTVKLPSGTNVTVVDISSQGVLLETASKITPGTAIDLRVIGQDTNVCVPARMMRTEVAAVDPMGVRYRVAAAFVSSLDIRGLEAQPVAGPVRPTALADLFARVLREVDQGFDAAALRSSFEQGLRRLLPVQAVQIRETPIIPSEGSESVYFTVPSTSGSQSILQAIFEPDYQPSALEFRLLKAAASLAAAVLELAPTGDARSRLA